MVINLDEIRINVETAISVFLATQQPKVRDIMIKAIMTELKRNNITRLWLGNVKVYLTKDGLGWDTTNLSPDERCQCGESYRHCALLYVHHANTDDEEHIYGCKCGHIYKVYWGC